MIQVRTMCRNCLGTFEKNFTTAEDAHAFTQNKPILCDACAEDVAKADETLQNLKKDTPNA